MMVISCIFIIFILLVFTIVIFYAKPNKTTMESFTTPTAVNVPAGVLFRKVPHFLLVIATLCDPKNQLLNPVVSMNLRK